MATIPNLMFTCFFLCFSPTDFLIKDITSAGARYTPITGSTP